MQCGPNSALSSLVFRRSECVVLYKALLTLYFHCKKGLLSTGGECGVPRG